MWPLLLDTARATTTGTTTCYPEVQATVPADGAVVPADVVFTALVDTWAGICEGEVALELLDAGGAPVPAERRSEPGTWELAIERLVPSSPLTPGATYTFRAVGPPESGVPPVEVGVTVGDAPPFPEVPPTSTLVVEGQTCDSYHLVLSVRVESELPLSGLLRTRYTVDDRKTTTFAAVDRQLVVEDATGAMFGIQGCATSWFEDLSGREVWSSETACGPEVVCPSYAPPSSVAFTVAPLCGQASPTTRLSVQVDLPPADPLASGNLDLYAGPADGRMRWQLSIDGRGSTWDPFLDANVQGRDPICFELRMYGRALDDQWVAGPYCTEEALECPDEPTGGATGTTPGTGGTPIRPATEARGGCASAPGPRGSGAVAAAILLLAARRSRSVRPAGLAGRVTVSGGARPRAR